MLKRLCYFFLLLVGFSCVEPYEFVINDNQKSLVIEAYISDKSFNETLLYPSDGRYFTTRLTYTGDVTNARPEMATGALVKLISKKGEEWVYTEVESGIYKLLDEDFKAVTNQEYQLNIVNGEEEYESSWQTLPLINAASIGDISFSETERQEYVVEASEKVLRTKKGITTHVSIPANESGHEIYYRWEYMPMWIYKAPLSSVSNTGHKCWAVDENYLPHFALQVDKAGGYKKDLFFMHTIRNERIFEDFSLLLYQFEMNQDYYFFWKELQDQVTGGALVDVPPYNLKTNFTSINAGKRVSGYFGVVREQAKRWYFNVKDLSYTVTNTLKGDCLVVYGPGGPAPECTNCLEYSFGKTTNIEPSWWRK